MERSTEMPEEDLSKLKIEKSVAFRPAGRRRWSGWIVFAALLVVAGLLYFTGVFTPAVKVEIASASQVYPSQAFTVLNASGYVVAQRKAAVASKTTGRLVWLGVEEGNRVKEGQVIARLENEDVTAERNRAAANLDLSRANLQQAKAELHDAGLSLSRNKELFTKGYVSRAEYDSAEARYKKAKAAVEGAEAAVKSNIAALRAADVAVEYTLIRSPFDAVVLTKNADIGDIVTPLGAAANAKAAVVTIADMKSLQVEVDVSESNIEKVKTGQPCEIQLDALPDVRFRGVVHMVVPTADRTKATVLVKVRFLENDNRILPEMSAKVAFLERELRPDERKPRLALNPSAILARNGRTVVFLVRDDRVIETAVFTGAQIGDMMEVTTGVKAGDRVVLKPSERLRSGTRIKVVEK